MALFTCTPWLQRRLFTLILMLQVLITGSSAQRVRPNRFLQGRQYLSGTGHYFHFLNADHTIYNMDTARYDWSGDTLHLTVLRQWIGESVHVFKEDLYFMVTFEKYGLRLVSLSSKGNRVNGDTLVLKDIGGFQKRKTSFRRFMVSKREYLTSGSDWDTTGRLVRSDTIFKLTSVSFLPDGQLVRETGHLTRKWEK